MLIYCQCQSVGSSLFI